VNAIFALDAAAFARQRRYPEAMLSYAVPGPRPDGTKGTWYDELVRIPDFLAGAASGTEFHRSQPVCVSEKYAQIVGEVFVDNPHVAVVKLSLPPHEPQAEKLALDRPPIVG
jgi:hypothetical protein